MKKFNEIIKKLQRALGEQAIVQENVLPEDNSAVQEEPTKIEPLAGVCCGFSEWDFIEATLCGEAGGCTESVKKQRVWGVIVNRTNMASEGSLKRGVCSVTGRIRQIIRNKQFTCWNDGGDGVCKDGVDPFSSCEKLKDRLKCLKGRCGGTTPVEGEYTDTSGSDALQELGFTPAEAGKVRHYMTVDAFINWGYMCQEAKDKIKTISKGNAKWEGCATVKCGNKTYKVCADGCHLYISGFN